MWPSSCAGRTRPPRSPCACTITTFHVEDTVEIIPSSAFAACGRLTSITGLAAVTSIGDSAFKGCTSLTSLALPGPVEYIGRDAFMRSGLTSFVWPADVKTVPACAFFECKSLERITNLGAVKQIGERAFAWSGLKSISWPPAVFSVPKLAFRCCASLTSITNLGGVTAIGVGAFYNTSALPRVRLPLGCTIDIAAFELSAGGYSIGQHSHYGTDSASTSSSASSSASSSMTGQAIKALRQQLVMALLRDVGKAATTGSHKNKGGAASSEAQAAAAPSTPQSMPLLSQTILSQTMSEAQLRDVQQRLSATLRAGLSPSASRSRLPRGRASRKQQQQQSKAGRASLSSSPSSSSSPSASGKSAAAAPGLVAEDRQRLVTMLLNSGTSSGTASASDAPRPQGTSSGARRLSSASGSSSGTSQQPHHHSTSQQHHSMHHSAPDDQVIGTDGDQVIGTDGGGGGGGGGRACLPLRIAGFGDEINEGVGSQIDGYPTHYSHQVRNWLPRLWACAPRLAAPCALLHVPRPLHALYREPVHEWLPHVQLVDALEGSRQNLTDVRDWLGTNLASRALSTQLRDCNHTAHTFAYWSTFALRGVRPLQCDESAPEVIFVDRGIDPRYSGFMKAGSERRSIHNINATWDVVRETAQSFGLRPARILFEGLPFHQQRRQACAARVVVGQHGAGLTHALWSGASRVAAIELPPEAAPGWFDHLLASNNIRHIKSSNGHRLRTKTKLLSNGSKATKIPVTGSELEVDLNVLRADIERAIRATTGELASTPEWRGSPLMINYLDSGLAVK